MIDDIEGDAMRVEFTGSPADVIRHMRDLLAIVDPEPRPRGYELQVPKPAAREKSDEEVIREIAARTGVSTRFAGMFLGPGHAIVDMPRETPPPPKPQPQTSDELACQFCGKYTHASARRVAGHEKHCKANPNRIPHPREGMPLPPGFGPRKKREADRASNPEPANDPNTSNQESKNDSGRSAPGNDFTSSSPTPRSSTPNEAESAASPSDASRPDDEPSEFASEPSEETDVTDYEAMESAHQRARDWADDDEDVDLD